MTAALQHWKVVVGGGEEGLLWHPFVREHVEVRLGGTSLPVYAKMNTVGPLYKRHSYFVHCREVVCSSEVENVLVLWESLFLVL